MVELAVKEPFESEMPYETLEDAIDLMEKVRDNQPAWGRFREPHERVIVFLVNLKKLYFECAGCDRVVAPDEERYQDPPSEDWYCMACLEEGI